MSAREDDRVEVMLDDELGALLRGVQIERRLEASASPRVEGICADLARKYKDQDLIPKATLQVMRVAVKVLRAEAPYLGAQCNVAMDLADRLEMIFDLVLLGETLDERIPGVPRVR